MRGRWLLHHQLRANVASSDARPAWAASAVAADDEAAMSKFAAPRWIDGKHPPKASRFLSCFMFGVGSTTMNQTSTCTLRCRDICSGHSKSCDR